MALVMIDTHRSTYWQSNGPVMRGELHYSYACRTGLCTVYQVTSSDLVAFDHGKLGKRALATHLNQWCTMQAS